MSTERVAAAVAAAITAALGGGCDPRAEPVGGGGVDDQLSRVGESCATSLHCRPGLRCFDQVCTTGETAVLGELYATMGASAFEGGDVERAIEAYGWSVKAYEQAQLAPPASVMCGQGRALVAARSDPTRGELAARVLHRCLLEARVGTPEREAALRALSLLLDVGLDPDLLARRELVDHYLTRAVRLPDTSTLDVAVTPKGTPPRADTFDDWLAVLRAEPARVAVAPCWQRFAEATLEDTLTVALVLRYSFRLDKYDDLDRSLLAVDAQASGEAPLAQASRCVAAALAPLADAYAEGAPEATWRATVELRIAPPR
jgi:hypothetical protein